MEGRATRTPQLPPEHELCVALGWARSRIDPNDIGPDLVFDMATGSGRHMVKVVQTLANALDPGPGKRGHRAATRCRPWLRVIAADAYARVVYGQRFEKPEAMTDDDWIYLTEGAHRVLVTMGNDAIDRAAGALRRTA
jgi:hypothetical protein